MTYFSKFGGLWIDSRDREFIATRLDAIDAPFLRSHVSQFISEGYTVIRRAIPGNTIDAYLREFEQAAEREDQLVMHVPTRSGKHPYDKLASLKAGSKILDTGMVLKTGRELSFAAPISTFLGAIFDEAALAFQTLHMEVGSTQAIHQDTAYVVVADEPLKMAAAWIALEDIEAGSGELVYYPTAHRMVETLYADGTSKHWNLERDGNAPHDAHLRFLTEETARLRIKPLIFAAKKGDVLFWHADLPHGGGPISRPMPASRRSLVIHYCPRSLRPHYSAFIPDTWRVPTEAKGGNCFMSLYYPPEQLAL